MTQLIHISVDTRRFGRWSSRRRFRDNDTAFHALITETFGRGALQPYRAFETPDSTSLYGYSTHTAEDLSALMERVATPDLMSVFGEEPKSKTMPRLEIGTRVGFDVRICPVRRSEKGERDAHDQNPLTGSGRSREEDYLKWFSEKVASAAALEEFRLHRFSLRQTARGGRRIMLPDAVAHGTFCVSDPDAFTGLLLGGVGRHKAYGYGMLLLRPPVRQ